MHRDHGQRHAARHRDRCRVRPHGIRSAGCAGCWVGCVGGHWYGRLHAACAACNGHLHPRTSWPGTAGRLSGVKPAAHPRPAVISRGDCASWSAKQAGGLPTDGLPCIPAGQLYRCIASSCMSALKVTECCNMPCSAHAHVAFTLLADTRCSCCPAAHPCLTHQGRHLQGRVGVAGEPGKQQDN